MSKTCNTPGKLCFDSRGEAYEHNKNLRLRVNIYECRCGKFHLTRHKKKYKH